MTIDLKRDNIKENNLNERVVKLMKSMIQAYQGYRETNDMNTVLKKELDITVVDVMVLHTIAHAEDSISKKELEQHLGLSKSISQKVTKQLRKDKMIIKDRDIDNESHVILSMNDEMKQKAETLFERVDKCYQTYKNPPQKQDENKASESDDVHSKNNNVSHEHERNNFNHKKHDKK